MSMVYSPAAFFSNCSSNPKNHSSMFFSRPMIQRNHHKINPFLTRPAMTSYTLDVYKPRNKNLKVTNSAPGPSGGPAGIPNIPLWAKLVLGSIVCLAIPFYKKVLSIDERVEKTAIRVVEAVEKVAETAEKVAVDIAKSLPENSKLKQEVVELENLAKQVDEDAEKIEEFIEKAEHITEEMEDLIDSTITKEVEKTKKETQTKKEENNSG